MAINAGAPVRCNGPLAEGSAPPGARSRRQPGIQWRQRSDALEPVR
jgi:hypothetical protein